MRAVAAGVDGHHAPELFKRFVDITYTNSAGNTQTGGWFPGQAHSQRAYAGEVMCVGGGVGV